MFRAIRTVRTGKALVSLLLVAAVAAGGTLAAPRPARAENLLNYSILRSADRTTITVTVVTDNTAPPASWTATCTQPSTLIYNNPGQIQPDGTKLYQCTFSVNPGYTYRVSLQKNGVEIYYAIG